MSAPDEPALGTPMIEVQQLSKRYGDFEAVQDMSFTVRRGEVLGFLGPNGAGKTTTMKILTCFMAPTGGRAMIGGKDVCEHSLAVRREIGYLPEDTPIYPDMTALEYLDFVGKIRDLNPAERRRRIGDLADVCGLVDILSRPVGHLSKGLRQRVGLAQAMLHDPPILVLDEPTSGLDPNQIVEIRQKIRTIGEQKTIILSTHILPEVQATCGRVIIINKGKLVADGAPDELTTRETGNSYRVLLDQLDVDPMAARQRLLAIRGVEAVVPFEAEPQAFGWQVNAAGDEDLRREIFACVRDAGWLLLELSRQRASLEDVFRRLTG